MSETSFADGDLADAGAVLARADAEFRKNRMAEAMNLYRTALAARPNNARALHRLALACVHANDFEEARKHIELVLNAALEKAELAFSHCSAVWTTRAARSPLCFSRLIDKTI